jgi:hypothetical protein
MISGLISAEWKVEEAPSVYTYKWEISSEDLTEFVKSGQVKSGISGSVYYNGRYYPVYSMIVEQSADELTYRIDDQNIRILHSTALGTKTKVDPLAQDRIDADVFSDFVKLNTIPGVGTLVEIMPILPSEDGSIKSLTKAEISLFPTNSRSLKKSDLKKDRADLGKIQTFREDLPDEFCALYIKKEGVFQVTGQDLIDKGIDIRYIHPDNIKLFWWGEEIPCRVTSTYELGQETFQPNDMIQFYIPEMKNPYSSYKYNPFSDYDVIHLYWNEGNGLRYVQENSEITGNATHEPEANRKFISTIHVEKNMGYQPLSRLHEEELSHLKEHQFFSPSIGIGESVDFTFELNDPVLDSPYSVDFTVRFQGLTYSVDDEMDHQVLVHINDQLMLQDEWEGQLPKISSNQNSFFSHEKLKNGENVIRVSVLGTDDRSAFEDLVFLDWLEVSYERYMKAHNNRLLFSPQHGPGVYLFLVEGLTSSSDVMILKNGTNWIRGYQVSREDTVNGEVTYSLLFEDECQGDEVYQIAGPGKEDDPDYGIVNVDSIRYVNTFEDDRYNNEPKGDYLIITHKDFFEKAHELADHKRDVGFIPAIYEAERIYDQYNYGNESPYAIKNFLSYAYKNWSITPEYVLLIGDTQTENSLPVMKYQSSGRVGAIIAENWYVDIDDDFMIEMALGRLPISTEEQLDSIIAKIKEYDEMNNPAQSNRIALLTGPEYMFKDQVQNYLNNVAPDYIQADRLYLYDATQTGDFDMGLYATDTLIDFIRDGVFNINYLGHGGGSTWDNAVLPYTAFEQFKPNKPFIVNSLTCYTNTFSNENALGEMFIRHPRGAVSILASTGFGWINSNYYLFENLMRHMHDDKMSHGRAVQYALADYFFSTFGKNANFIDQVDGKILYKYFRRTLFYQMCILGDPSATFPHLRETELTVTPRSVNQGDEISINASELGVRHGTLDLVGTKGDKRKYPLKQKVRLDFNQGTSTFTIPEIAENISDGMLQMSLWDENNNTFVSTSSIAFGAPYISALNYYPSKPGIQDEAVDILLKLESYQNVDSVNLRIYNDRSINKNYQILPLKNMGAGEFKSANPIIYINKSSFYTTETDSSTPVDYFTGNYAIPEFRIGGEILTGDFYSLMPNAPNERDISILEYSVEKGKSKVVLYNQADTSSYVKLSLEVDEGAIQYSYVDTVLTSYDVDGHYVDNDNKINTFYFNFLPIYGNGTVHIEIEPLSIEDADSSNNMGDFPIDNKWLRTTDRHFVNNANDTANAAGNVVSYLLPGEKAAYNGAAFVNAYTRSYDLSDFGASQADQSIMYINTEDDEIDMRGAIPLSALTGDKLICYLSVDLDVFYTLPVSSVDTNGIFPITKAGYYLLATATESQGPNIELNINAREVLTGGFVSERSDFSVIMNDEHGVHPLPDYWGIYLDGEEIAEEDVSVVPRDDIREIGLNFKLSMDEGLHTLQVVAHDLVGNQTETEEYEIEYTGESELIDYGNYPNPFKSRTTFIYELTEQFDDVTIKIYTLSGQKIFTMSVSENAITDLPLYSIGYHEVPWSGKDEFGNVVASGVYFYVIEGVVDGKKIKSTGKFAKLI